MDGSGIAGAAALGSGLSAITHSVVRSIPAIDAAFSRAMRVTLVGSITPAFSKGSNTSVRALKPKSALPSLMVCTTIDPSTPEFLTIWRIGSSMARLMMEIPVVSSALRPLNFSRAAVARI